MMNYLMNLNQDKYLHILGGMVLMLILCFFRLDWFGKLVILIAVAGLKEFSDVMLKKKFDWQDLSFSIGGGVFALILNVLGEI